MFHLLNQLSVVFSNTKMFNQEPTVKTINDTTNVKGLWKRLCFNFFSYILGIL